MRKRYTTEKEEKKNPHWFQKTSLYRNADFYLLPAHQLLVTS